MYAEGNQISVDSGQTAQYVYDAFNRRVWIHTNGNSSEQEPAYQEIDYDLNGKRLSIWDGSSGNLQKVQLYWGIAASRLLHTRRHPLPASGLARLGAGDHQL